VGWGPVTGAQRSKYTRTLHPPTYIPTCLQDQLEQEVLELLMEALDQAALGVPAHPALAAAAGAGEKQAADGPKSLRVNWGLRGAEGWAGQGRAGQRERGHSYAVCGVYAASAVCVCAGAA